MNNEIKNKIIAMSKTFNRSQIAAMLKIHKHKVDKVLDAPIEIAKPKVSKINKEK
tara:strand:+ start:119 stop:283 length:165 start_codon:yes stop_codon:yes gene_type:complete